MFLPVLSLALFLLNSGHLKQPDWRPVAAPILRAQGHPMYVDFLARSQKRADLRLNIATKGADVAFTEWLRREHPLIYRRDAPSPDND